MSCHTAASAVNGDERAHNLPLHGETPLPRASACGDEQASCRVVTTCRRPVNLLLMQRFSATTGRGRRQHMRNYDFPNLCEW